MSTTSSALTATSTLIELLVNATPTVANDEKTTSPADGSGAVPDECDRLRDVAERHMCKSPFFHPVIFTLHVIAYGAFFFALLVTLYDKLEQYFESKHVRTPSELRYDKERRIEKYGY